MNLQPTLQDNLVTLRPLERHHLEPLYAVAKDPLIWVHHRCPDLYQRSDFELFFEEALASEAALIVIDRQEEKVIGSSRFKMLEQLHQQWKSAGLSFLETDRVARTISP